MPGSEARRPESGTLHLRCGDTPMTPPEVTVSAACAVIRKGDGDDEVRGPFDLEVRSGEFLAVLGPRGSGKSTLLRMVAGLLPLSSGEIRVAGRKVVSPQTDIGIVFEKPLLLEWRTALENVLLQTEIRGMDRNASVEQARRLLVMLGLEGFETRKPHDLPPGMAVRVALCRALVHNPTLLLLDDPFHDLDPLEREQIAPDLQRLGLTPGTTILFATHLPAEAVQLSDRVAVLSPGGCIQQCLTIDLPRPRRFDRATTPRISEYCSSIRTLLHAQGTLQ